MDLRPGRTRIQHPEAKRLIWRAALALLLVTGWIWQERRHLSAVDLYLTTAHARPGLAPRLDHYPRSVPAVCVYLIYSGARPGQDHYSYRFTQGAALLLQGEARTVPVAHGAALDCFATAGALAPGRYVASLEVNGHLARRLPFVVAGGAGAR